MRIAKSKPKPSLEQLNDLRNEIIKLKDEGRKIISHYTKLEEYYNDWQDRLYKVELEVQKLEKETGLDQEEITEFNIVDDVLELIK